MSNNTGGSSQNNSLLPDGFNLWSHENSDQMSNFTDFLKVDLDKKKQQDENEKEANVTPPAPNGLSELEARTSADSSKTELEKTKVSDVSSKPDTSVVAKVKPSSVSLDVDLTIASGSPGLAKSADSGLPQFAVPSAETFLTPPKQYLPKLAEAKTTSSQPDETVSARDASAASAAVHNPLDIQSILAAQPANVLELHEQAAAKPACGPKDEVETAKAIFGDCMEDKYFVPLAKSAPQKPVDEWLPLDSSNRPSRLASIVRASATSETAKPNVNDSSQRRENKMGGFSSSSVAQYWLQSLGHPNAILGDSVSSTIQDQWADNNPAHKVWSETAASAAVQPAESRFWKCDYQGNVISFVDQNNVNWEKHSELDGVAMFKSRDGGECVADARIIDGMCMVEDQNGCLTAISTSGAYSVKMQKQSREDRVRALMILFRKVDANGDERLSLAELEDALNSTWCDEADKNLIRSLRVHFKRVEWTRRGMFGQGTQGLSLKEILEFTSNGDRSTNDINEALVSQIENLIDYADARRTGRVDLFLLNEALRYIPLPYKLKNAVRILLKRCAEVSLLSSCGFDAGRWKPSRQAVRLMLCDLFKRLPDGDPNIPAPWAQLELAAANARLFADDSNRRASIKLAAFADCLDSDQPFMSAVLALAVRRPDQVINMIRPSDNGAYMVTFPGDPNLPVRVIMPTQKEIFEYGHSSHFGIWVMILERAFAEYKNQRALRARVKDVSPEMSRRHDDALFVEETTSLLSGSAASIVSLKSQSAGDLASLIDVLWNSGRMIVIARHPHEDETEDATIVLCHTCAVTDWEPESGTVTLSNPQTQTSEACNITSLRRTFHVLIHG